MQCIDCHNRLQFTPPQGYVCLNCMAQYRHAAPVRLTIDALFQPGAKVLLESHGLQLKAQSPGTVLEANELGILLRYEEHSVAFVPWEAVAVVKPLLPLVKVATHE